MLCVFLYLMTPFLIWWAHLGSNQGPTGYEPVALPTELWAPIGNLQLNCVHIFSFVLLVKKFNNIIV